MSKITLEMLVPNPDTVAEHLVDELVEFDDSVATNYTEIIGKVFTQAYAKFTYMAESMTLSGVAVQNTQGEMSDCKTKAMIGAHVLRGLIAFHGERLLDAAPNQQAMERINALTKFEWEGNPKTPTQRDLDTLQSIHEALIAFKF